MLLVVHESLVSLSGAFAGQPARREIEQAADLKTSVLSLPPSWQRLISSVADKQKIKNPATGLVHDATWIGNLTRHGHHTYVLKVDGTGERLPLPNWRLEIKYVEMQDLQKGNPIGTWLTSQSRLGDSLESIQFLVLVSQTAWSTDTIKQLESLIQNRPSLKIVLINLQAKQPTIPFENAYCYELTKWLNWESESDRVLRIIRHIQKLRPLEASLSAQEVASQLTVPIELVVSTFRNLVASESLRIDNVQPFGWVLSEKL